MADIWKDVDEVISPTKQPYPVYSVIIHTEEKELHGYKLLSYDIIRNYVSSYTDERYVKVMVPLGEYMADIYPYLSLLEVTVVTTIGDVVTVERLKGIETIDPTETTDMELLTQGDYDSLDQIHYHTLNLQVMNLGTEPLPQLTVSGVYNEITRDQLLRTIIPEICNTIDVSGSSPIDDIEVLKSNNTVPLTEYIIPTGTKLLNLPKHIQEKGKGLYTGGVGSYIQAYKGKNIWFIYPPFDYDRDNEIKDKLVINLLSGKHINEYENTININGKTITIVAEIQGENPTSIDQVGTVVSKGVMLNDGDETATRPLESDGKIVQSKSTKVNRRMLSSKRSDGLDTIAVTKHDATANHYVAQSKVSMTEGKRIDVVWKHSNPFLLRPVMPVAIHQEMGDRVIKRKGVLIFNQTIIGLRGKNMLATDYTSSTIMSIFIDTTTEHIRN